MKKFYGLSLILAFICVVFISLTYFRSLHITKITSFSQINFVDIPVDSLVCFDVDETLIAPEDSFLMHIYSKKAKLFIKQLMVRYPEVKDWDDLQSLIFLQGQRPLIEKDVVFMIRALQQLAIPVIIFTAMNTGSLGLIDRLEVWRYHELKLLGIEGSFSDKEFNFEYKNKRPVFYKGLLCADLLPKGDVLGLFLDAINYTPSLIVMIDDTLSFLQSVEQECIKRNIAFKGYHYCGYKQEPWNQKIIEIQAEYLIKHRQWLSDAQVKKQLEKLNASIVL